MIPFLRNSKGKITETKKQWFSGTGTREGLRVQRGTSEVFGVMEMFYVLDWGGYTAVYICQNSNYTFLVSYTVKYTSIKLIYKMKLKTFY